MNKFHELWSDIDGAFWVAVSAGILVKIILSEKLTKKQVLASVGCGLFCAFYLPDVVMGALRLEGDFYVRTLTAIFALTGEHIVRRVIEFSKTGTVKDVKDNFK